MSDPAVSTATPQRATSAASGITVAEHLQRVRERSLADCVEDDVGATPEKALGDIANIRGP